MRTTLTLDDDVAAALKERVRLTGRSGRSSNETLRRGLSCALLGERPGYRVRPHDSGFRPGVDPLRLNQLGDSLDAGAFTGSSTE